MRFTVQPSTRVASSTNAGVTPAPPDDTSRSDATRSGRKPAAPINVTKNVGGPIMNVMRSASMIRSASSGSQRAMSTTFIGTTPGSSTPLSKPDTWARGAGISTASSSRNPCTRAISAALYARPRCVWITPFGTPLEPDVNSTTASSSSLATDPGATGEPWVRTSDLPKDPAGTHGTAAYGPAPDQGQCDGTSEDFSSRDSFISPVISIPKGTAVARKLSFDHYVATELGFDGGNVKFRISGGKWKVIPAGAYTFNAPDQLASAAQGSTNPMAGEPGFTGTDGGEVTGSWGTSQVNLSALKVSGGNKVQFRFDIGRDGCGGIDGWYVDDIEVTVCLAAAGARTAGTAPGRRN